jgi:hypothetical protein
VGRSAELSAREIYRVRGRESPKPTSSDFRVRYAVSGTYISHSTCLRRWPRRVCPGMYFADRVGFHIGVCIISLYDIIPVSGENLPDSKRVKFSDTAFRCVNILRMSQLLIYSYHSLPVGLKCNFRIRNEKADRLLKAIALED